MTLIVNLVLDAGDKGPPTEVERFEQLQAGMTFDRFQAVLGGKPDVRRRLPKRRDAPDVGFLREADARRFIFVRESAYVQAVVADGSVLAFAIVARTPAAGPTYRFPTERTAMTLGRSRLEQSKPDRVGGFCGASRAQYFETFGGSNADNNQEFAVGVSSLGVGSDEVFDAVCAAGGALERCGADSYLAANVVFAPDAARCVLRAPAAASLRRRPVTVYVETAPTVPISSALLAPIENDVLDIAPR